MELTCFFILHSATGFLVEMELTPNFYAISGNFVVKGSKMIPLTAIQLGQFNFSLVDHGTVCNLIINLIIL